MIKFGRVYPWVLAITIAFAGARPTSCLAYQTTQSFLSYGSTITVHIEPEPPPVSEAAVLAWVRTAARAVSAYYGRFPVSDVRVMIDTGDHGGRIHHGVTYRGRRITIDLAQDTREEDFGRDWELTHEMFHLAFPLLDEDYDWMGEGLSDYMEPIARVRIGTLSVPIVWRDLVEGLPKGLPKAADQGLDHTHTWGRIYWGGTLYWLLADLEIRRRTQGKRSIHDALQAILDAGGNGRTSWDLDKVLDVGDKATGTRVLHELHDRMGDKPYAPDLDDLWKRLGVIYNHRQITFDEAAPEAALRKSITDNVISAPPTLTNAP